MMAIDPDSAVMIADADGAVVRADARSKAQFGTCRGRHCYEIVAATGRHREPLCSRSCALAVAQGGARSIALGAIVGVREQSIHCRGVAGQIVVSVTPLDSRLESVLSPREIEVLRLVAAGETGRRIAELLGIGAQTVRTHVDRARKKLGARTRPEVVAIAVRMGLSS